MSERTLLSASADEPEFVPAKVGDIVAMQDNFIRGHWWLYTAEAVTPDGRVDSIRYDIDDPVVESIRSFYKIHVLPAWSQPAALAVYEAHHGLARFNSLDDLRAAIRQADAALTPVDANEREASDA